jgi:replicative DNA helicase
MAGVVVELTGDEAKLLASMQKIIAQNARSKDSFKATGREAKSSVDEINKALDKKLQSLASVSVAYKAVEIGVAAVSKAQQVMIEKQAKALQLAKELAAAQQEAAKNLAGQTTANISKALLETVPSIAVKTGFSDLPKLTTALGSSASIIGEELAPSAVEVAAQLTRFTKGTSGLSFGQKL